MLMPAAAAKRPRAPAPAVSQDIIDITDTDEDRTRPPRQTTESLPALELKYDADGAIVIDDDEDEPAADSAATLPKMEKPLSTVAEQALVQPLPSPSPEELSVNEVSSQVPTSLFSSHVFNIGGGRLPKPRARANGSSARWYSSGGTATGP